MPNERPREPKLRYEDIPSLPETFADSIGQWYFDGSTLRIEFTVSRFDERKSSEQRTGRKLPACRLVLSTGGAIELLRRCRQFTAALEKAGLLKQQAAKEPDAAPSS